MTNPQWTWPQPQFKKTIFCGLCTINEVENEDEYCKDCVIELEKEEENDK